jgi:hypothetical protein
MVTRSRLLFVGTVMLAGILSVSCSTEDGAQAQSPRSRTPLPAAPVSADQRFITAVGGTISGLSRDGIQSLGRRACGAFSEGSSAKDIRTILVGKGLTDAQANRVVLAAASTYCPEYGDKAMG